jgi:uncharacterized protein YndB with AHSA1/START domain
MTTTPPDEEKEEGKTDAGNSISLIVRRTIQASVKRVFEAWTSPEHLVRWWGPRPVRCDEAVVDLRVGGEYRISNRFPDGNVLLITGKFDVVDVPSRLVYSWRIEGKSDHDSTVTVRFEPRGADATEVIVIHNRIDSESTRADHEHGWIGCLDGLERLFHEL